MAHKNIIIRGARTHNLKNIDVTIPRDKLTVITGMSGSGKSSLAFDTLYAEGQRRYVESLSAYARQFLGQVEKPDVDLIEGLSPAVSVEQKSTSHNPRSTVGTVTEIYDYLRLLFSRVGESYCPNCDKKIEPQTIPQILDWLYSERENQRLAVLAPVVINRKGEHQEELTRLRAQGFTRVKINDTLFDLSDSIVLDKKQKHNIDVVIDRLSVLAENKARLSEAFELAMQWGQGVAKIDFLNETRQVIQTHWVSQTQSCLTCHLSLPPLEPQIFSFNSPQGACEKCNGLGHEMAVDETLVIPDENLSINKGAIVPWFGKKTNYYQSLLEAVAKTYQFDLNTPYTQLPKPIKKLLFNGTTDTLKVKSAHGVYSTVFEGINNNLQRRYKNTESEWMRGEIAKFMSAQDCADCLGARLKKTSLSVKIEKQNIALTTQLSVESLYKFISELNFKNELKIISQPIIKEILARLTFLKDVGLNYLTLDRKSSTLSGGESQRIRLATQIGSALVGVTYVLDEPSIGLHQRDNDRLLATLKNLRDVGNTVVVVEHDEDTIKSADYIVDLGPKAGIYGGEVVFQGSFAGLLLCQKSLTAEYLCNPKLLPYSSAKRSGHGFCLTLRNASANNLKNVTVDFPLGKLICVTGVSGSGKSTLINDTLYLALMRYLHQSRVAVGKFDALVGTQHVDKVINIDQSPIGRTPRSNPATYTGLFTDIRDLFCQMPQARERGYKPGRFSFNVPGGRCEKCEGDGQLRIEMHFLADVFVKCEECQGQRFNSETLSVYYKNKNIADVLNLSVAVALEFFLSIPALQRKIETLNRVGLGYITLGQAATTLSGGEAQRIKLAKELSKRQTGRTLYILDEPTTGLHFEDIRQLMQVLNELVDYGNTVIIIEHNMHVIKMADHIIDLGPNGGVGGGQIVAQGTPSEVAMVKSSFTGLYLKPYLQAQEPKQKIAG